MRCLLARQQLIKVGTRIMRLTDAKRKARIRRHLPLPMQSGQSGARSLSPAGRQKGVTPGRPAIRRLYDMLNLFG